MKKYRINASLKKNLLARFISTYLGYKDLSAQDIKQALQEAHEETGISIKVLRRILYQIHHEEEIEWIPLDPKDPVP